MTNKKIKAKCDTCNFSLTSGEAKVGDTCPWCNRGILQEPSND